LRALVNNAGIGVSGPIEFISREDWLKQFDVNLFGQAAMTQSLLPLLRQYAARAESTARVIMIGSIAGRLAQPTLGPYCASKSALRTLSASLRMELRPQKIDVSLIEPGAIQSEIWNKGKEAGTKLGPDHPARKHYGKAIDAINAISAKSAKGAIPAETVARVVEKCITRRRPRTSILVGMDAKMGAALQWLLPESWFEAIVRKAVGF
jgi:short-subunit dehydrogenase